MLRSETPLDPAVLHELGRLDAVLTGSATGSGSDPAYDSGSTDSDAALDQDLARIVSGVRAVRPEPDAAVRARLADRARQAKAAAAGRSARPSAERRWRLGLALAAVAAVALPVGVAVRHVETGSDGPVALGSSTVGSSDGARPGGAAAGSSSRAGAPSADAAPEATAASPASPLALERQFRAAPGPRVPPGAESSVADGAADLQPGDAARSGPAPAASPAARPAPLSAPRRVVRDVRQTVRVAPRDVARAAARVTAVVQDAGGYLASSEVRERGPGAGGTFAVVVPVGRLDATVAALSRIGRPVRLERSETDVTDQATSLGDRLEDLRSDRAALRLQLARTVDPARRAARRRELTLLSSRVAALQAERDALRRQTAAARIDLLLTTGTAADEDPVPVTDDGSWGLDDAWDDAGRVLQVGGGVVLLGAVAVIPLATLLTLGLLARRRIVRRRGEELLDRS